MVLNRALFELSGKVVFGTISFNPPFKAGESLIEEARFVSVLSGKSKLYVPNGTLDLQSSDSFIMKCENFVNHWLERDDGQPNELIIVHFYPDILQLVYDGKLPEIFSSKARKNPAPVEKIHTNEMLEHFLQGMKFYFEHPQFVTDELIKIKLKELIEILVNSDSSGKIKSILSELFQSNEYEFKEIIHSHLYEDLSIQDLALFAGLSLSSFKRKFNAVFGTSPTRYIKSRRLEKAQSMLQMTNQRISEIAYDCGFNDIAYFSKTFHAAYDVTPSDYRKNYLSQISK